MFFTLLHEEESEEMEGFHFESFVSSFFKVALAVLQEDS